MTDIHHPPLPRQVGEVQHWQGLRGSALSLAIVTAARQHRGPVLVVTSEAQDAERLETEIGFYAAGAKLPVLHLPDWETLPFDIFSPHQDIVSRRLQTLYRMPDVTHAVIVMPVNTLIQRLPPVAYVSGNTLLLACGDRLDPTAMCERLSAAGYNRATQVMEHGEFALRGSLLDIYPMGSELPFRIDLFDNEVDSIRTFNPETQLSLEKVDVIEVLPAREFALDENSIKEFRRRYRLRFEGNPQASLIYRDVSQGVTPGGIEYYLPLFFDQTSTLFDYLPANTLVIQDQEVAATLTSGWTQIQDRHEQRRHNNERPLLDPAEVFLDPVSAQNGLQRFTLIQLAAAGDNPNHAVDFGCSEPPLLLLDARAPTPAAAVAEFLRQFPGRALFAAESAGRREVLADVLIHQGLRPKPYHDWAEFMADNAPLGMVVAPLERGLLLPNLTLITEPQLFGERVRQKQRRKAARDPATIIRDLTDLAINAPVVHEQHGVGRYLGLTLLDIGGVQGEYLAIAYAGGDKLYVPVASLHFISRYTGMDPEHAPLHRLGSDQWEKARRKAAEKAHDAAAELLEIQARRAASTKEPIHFDEAEYRAFAAGFPFEETPDQQTTIDSVIADLTSERSMDRVVCGDVGFGKTEVAMRAAFVAVNGGKQVIILVPTTLLAQQHFRNFNDRFADWPIRIEMMSRLQSAKEQKSTLDAMANGNVDIIIGTHKLLQEQIRYKDLGLVIVDEEHRFGVRHKEQLKKLRAQVDLLTLTATPIPRTLNMGLAGLRDLSIIATPPVDRLAVKTFISEWDDNLIQEACLREIKRGGQVYFLHNEVESIQRIADQLATLVPQARIEIAHGQMPERLLEQVMLDFYHRRFNILVCTTIIESGIDVPTANTILVNRADKLGLAQLHQLRGRVGRSHHRAYAYLLTPSRNAITADAQKRLEAIEALGELGSGFTLATHDLEIRGAGELLGEEQSGQIEAVGFSLYSELLERAVKAIRRGELPNPDEPMDHGPEVDLRLPALLPEDYVPDVHLRLILYKRLASARNNDELRELQIEMIDRFGLLPPAAKNLIQVTELRLVAAELGIRKLEAGPQGGRIIFGDKPQINAAAVIKLLQTQPKRYRMDGQHILRYTLPMAEDASRSQIVTDLLRSLGTAKHEPSHSTEPVRLGKY